MGCNEIAGCSNHTKTCTNSMWYQASASAMFLQCQRYRNVVPPQYQCSTTAAQLWYWYRTREVPAERQHAMPRLFHFRSRGAQLCPTSLQVPRRHVANDGAHLGKIRCRDRPCVCRRSAKLGGRKPCSDLQGAMSCKSARLGHSDGQAPTQGPCRAVRCTMSHQRSFSGPPAPTEAPLPKPQRGKVLRKYHDPGPQKGNFPHKCPFRPSSIELRPHFASIWPTSQSLGRRCSKVVDTRHGNIVRSHFDRCWAEFNKARPTLARTDRRWS